jgi:hypothetical protein
VAGSCQMAYRERQVLVRPIGVRQIRRRHGPDVGGVSLDAATRSIDPGANDKRGAMDRDATR